MLHRVHLAMNVFELITLVVIGADCIGSCKSNYHTTVFSKYSSFVLLRYYRQRQCKTKPKLNYKNFFVTRFRMLDKQSKIIWLMKKWILFAQSITLPKHLKSLPVFSFVCNGFAIHVL
jgi:hypothetical protein